MKAPAKILLYFAAVFLLGALLSAPLFWAVRNLAPAAEARGWLRYEVDRDGERDAKGWCAFLDADFVKVSNRASLLVAVVLLVPLLKSLHIRSLRDLGLEPNRRRWRDFFTGWGTSVVLMALLGAVLLKLGVYKLKTPVPWKELAAIAFGKALVVPFIEEWLFRGAILGSFRQGMIEYAALFWVTALFAVLHFVSPPEAEIPPESVQWFSGFSLLPERFEKFHEPLQFLAGFTTLFVFGWICGWAVIRTRGLALGIGFHAGMILGKFGFNKMTTRPKDMRGLLPWIGEDMAVGLVAVGILLLIGFILWSYTRWLRSKPAAAP